MARRILASGHQPAKGRFITIVEHVGACGLRGLKYGTHPGTRTAAGILERSGLLCLLILYVVRDVNVNGSIFHVVQTEGIGMCGQKTILFRTDM